MRYCADLVDSFKRHTVHYKTPFVKELVGGLIMGLRTILHCDGYTVHRKERLSIDYLVDLFCPFDDAEAVEVVKYLTSRILPKLVGDEEPARPSFLSEDSTLMTHGYQRYIGRIFQKSNGVTRRQIRLATSILQLKRCLPPLSKKLKIAAAEKLAKTLSTPAASDTKILDQIARTAAELFPLGWDSNCPIPSYTASNKSGFGITNDSGGVQNHIYDPVAEVGTSRLDQIMDFQVKTDLLGASETMLPEHPNAGQDKFEETARRTVPPQLAGEVFLCDEPLKVRAITTNAWQCNILKPLQKLIHKQLKRSDVFLLTYGTVSGEIMSRIPLFPGSKFVSGDFKAATDNMHSDATETCLDTILGNMTGPLSRDISLQLLAKRSCTGLQIFGKDFSPFIMKRGQLMGSLLSFPLLCVINFATWRHSTELTEGRRCNGLGEGGRADHVLVNGDDIGFAATKAGYERWKAMTPRVGLTPSPGKNYFTSRFLMLNSRLYVFGEESRSMENVPFLNLALLACPGKECNLLNLEALGVMHNDFVEGARMQNVAAGVFISNHKELLRMSWRNLYGPRALGGLGATPVKGTVSESMEGYSVRQLVIAKLLQDEVCHMYPSGMVSRYDAFQKQYLDRLFPDVQVGSSLEKENLETMYEIEDLTEVVGLAKISFMAMCSWLSPLRNTPRSLWQMANSLKKKFTGLQDKRQLESKRLDVVTYLEARGEVLLYRKTAELYGGEANDVFL